MLFSSRFEEYDNCAMVIKQTKFITNYAVKIIANKIELV